MKILHIIESDGGSFDFIYLIAKYLPQHHHIVICGERAFSAYKKLECEFGNSFPENMEAVYWEHAQREIKIFADVKALSQLIKVLRNQSDANVVHLHSSKAGFLGRAACFILGIRKVVYTTHAVSFLRCDVSFFVKNTYKILERIAHALLPCKVICCSESECKAMQVIGIKPIVIPNGTEVDSLVEQKNGAKNFLTVGTVGRITIQKNPHQFNSIALKFAQSEAVRFVWIGDGELRNVLKSPNIEVTGWLTKKELYRQLSQIDIYLSTALWEGMPLAVLESMAIGKPLLLSDCVGNVDLVTNDENGYIFKTESDAHSKLLDLLNDQSKREKFGLKSEEKYAINYHMGIISSLYHNLYCELQQ